MTRRTGIAAAGVVALLASFALAPARPRARSLPAPPWVTLLGPLRPFFAELVRLRFEATRGADEVLGQLDDAWSVLALAPERVDDFVHFGWYFVVDAPRLARFAAEREACARAGFEILRAGQDAHPRSARLRYAEGLVLEQVARHAPERLAALELHSAEAARGRSLALFEEALALAAPADPDRAFIRVALALCAEKLLVEPSTSPELRARARAAAERLLAEPDLAEESRRVLKSALASAPAH